jgi:ATP-dependent exoDNAse (exonuclease V) beta subunit
MLQEEHVYTAGQSYEVALSEKEKELQNAAKTNFYHPMAISDQLWYPSLSFRSPDAEILPDQLFGLAFHRFMSLCQSPEQMQNALQQALQEGSVAQEHIAELTVAVNRFWSHVQEQQLQEGILEEYNEQRIIADINLVKQPDKVWVKANEVVVIDFKTGLRQDSHMQQIIAYAGLLEKIFSLPVRPILYYTQLDLFLEL